MTPTAKILLLGSGELGREFTISAKRLGASDGSEESGCSAADDDDAFRCLLAHVK